MSHSQKLAAIIICDKYECGIDVEFIDKKVDWALLAHHHFHPKEYNQVKLHKEDAFFRIWTLKEAFIKSTGKGLSFPLKDFCVDIKKKQSH